MKSLIRKGRDWEFAPPPDDVLIERIQTALCCAPPFAILLARRGGPNWERLIDPGFHNLHSPFEFEDMEKGTLRLVQAIERQQRLFIHGDFDVDGLTGAAVLYQGLSPLFPKGRIKVEVGDRGRGHGLSREFVSRAIAEGFALVVTVDCGISNSEEIEQLRRAGIDTIVTDHHIPPPELPPAVAVIDPQRPGEPYPNPHLAGVGVAYKLVCALYERLGRPIPHHLLDLVALGTLADLVPLAQGGEVENRAMVKEGFSLVSRREGSSLGLQVLMEKLSIDPQRLTASDIGYIIAPKLNAANRTGDPKVAFLLLTTGISKRAEYLTEVLLDYNRDREIAQDDLICQAEERMAQEGIDPAQDGMIVLRGKYWNEGILGLVASSLTDRYRVPAIVISEGDQVSRASCRSVDGFDIASCLDAHADLLLQYGGHEMAAGFSVSNDLLPELCARLSSYIAARGKNHQPTATRWIDAEVGIDQIDMRFYTNLRSLSPYGPGNPVPLFLLRDCAFEALTMVGTRGQHLKGKVVRDGFLVSFIAFRMGRYINAFEQARGASCVFRAGFNSLQGSVQLEVVDLVEG